MTLIKGGKHIPPNRKRLADDLLDKGEARETESMKDVLTRLGSWPAPTTTNSET